MFSLLILEVRIRTSRLPKLFVFCSVDSLSMAISARFRRREVAVATKIATLGRAKLGNELSQIPIQTHTVDNKRYSTVYGLLPKSFKF